MHWHKNEIHLSCARALCVLQCLRAARTNHHASHEWVIADAGRNGCKDVCIHYICDARTALVRSASKHLLCVTVRTALRLISMRARAFHSLIRRIGLQNATHTTILYGVPREFVVFAAFIDRGNNRN